MKGPRERILECFFADRTRSRDQVMRLTGCDRALVAKTLSSFIRERRPDPPRALVRRGRPPKAKPAETTIAAPAFEAKELPPVEVRRPVARPNKMPPPLREPLVITRLPPRLPKRPETCVKIKYQTGVGIYECGTPSDGRPYCRACMAAQATAPAGTRYAGGSLMGWSGKMSTAA